ncbi:MAG: hypothetical protein JWM91_738 [Rhodospirillales bacterium]|nr:hypothetical protein [Rhodospirillales bacterium]
MRLSRSIIKPKLQLWSPSSDHSFGVGEGRQYGVLLLITGIAL